MRRARRAVEAPHEAREAHGEAPHEAREPGREAPHGPPDEPSLNERRKRTVAEYVADRKPSGKDIQSANKCSRATAARDVEALRAWACSRTGTGGSRKGLTPKSRRRKEIRLRDAREGGHEGPDGCGARFELCQVALPVPSRQPCHHLSWGLMRVNAKASARGAAGEPIIRRSGRVQRNASRAGPCVAIVRRRCRCLDCCQVRIEEEYAFTPNANPFSHLLAKTARRASATHIINSDGLLPCHCSLI